MVWCCFAKSILKVILRLVNFIIKRSSIAQPWKRRICNLDFKRFFFFEKMSVWTMTDFQSWKTVLRKLLWGKIGVGTMSVSLGLSKWLPMFAVIFCWFFFSLSGFLGGTGKRGRGEETGNLNVCSCVKK